MNQKNLALPNHSLNSQTFGSFKTSYILKISISLKSTNQTLSVSQMARTKHLGVKGAGEPCTPDSTSPTPREEPSQETPVSSTPSITKGKRTTCPPLPRRSARILSMVSQSNKPMVIGETIEINNSDLEKTISATPR